MGNNNQYLRSMNSDTLHTIGLSLNWPWLSIEFEDFVLADGILKGTLGSGESNLHL